MLPQKGQKWELSNGDVITIRDVSDIVLYNDPNDEDATCWNFISEFIQHATLIVE